MLNINKKGQDLPVNVIIVAIIVLVVLIIVVAFFAGGFSNIVGKIRGIFGGGVSGQERDIAIQTCQQLCDNAKRLPTSTQGKSGYCTNSYLVDDDGSSETPPVRSICGSQVIKSPTITPEELDRGIKAGTDLGVQCDIVCTTV